MTKTGLVKARERDRIKNMLRLLADEKAKALADEKEKEALTTKESGGGEGDSEGDEREECDDEDYFE